MTKKRISHTEGRKRRERLHRAIDKRATALLKALRESAVEDHKELIADALYVEASRSAGRERTVK